MEGQFELYFAFFPLFPSFFPPSFPLFLGQQLFNLVLRFATRFGMVLFSHITVLRYLISGNAVSSRSVVDSKRGTCSSSVRNLEVEGVCAIMFQGLVESPIKA